jgi:hypothetical protein
MTAGDGEVRLRSARKIPAMNLAFAELPHFNDPAFVKGGRSPRSFAFEVLWRAAVPKRGLPRRKRFLSENSAALADNIVLVDHGKGRQATVIDAGVRIRADMDPGFVGSNYLDLLPEAYRKGAWWSLGAMVSRPCGLWQMMPVHEGRKRARIVELTAFPLMDDETGNRLVCCYLLPCATTRKKMSVDGVVVETAIDYKFIDLGAGVPDL